jgi:hypothetical protein
MSASSRSANEAVRILPPRPFASTGSMTKNMSPLRLKPRESCQALLQRGSGLSATYPLPKGPEKFLAHQVQGIHQCL